MATEEVDMSGKRYTDEFKIEAVEQVTVTLPRFHVQHVMQQRVGLRQRLASGLVVQLLVALSHCRHGRLTGGARQQATGESLEGCLLNVVRGPARPPGTSA
ncbi:MULTISPECIES: hypothetical protein [Burkholderia]|uniref:Transposase n=1 Tax=Burkholderia cepacia TaxID=292 RepID=A0ABN5CWH8_BURCE|nr:hypothetical protein [Burkholderia cepacia]ALK23747.1 hypothetical protein APZ15_38175 [Burkholderia cepacia ATCC 25416]ASE92110.1 hypothetical protein CEQ23_00010 [Burkholderia cepacia]ATF79566.1 hypothetical protein CO711_19020 [Burkholderia cepacia]MCA7896692.1 hypothetical protein [Burkholderia cepacia]MCA7941896.1 hypothetical protein [Burkholderia cepacia]